ncbi:hypothetical protein [Flavobacterium panacagri]|uniref:hypothetical protein n=1 Tax=Flavobacterium panacagri TaxID=3034146 RepID=UPI0025A601CB|nr:hypothetical protein [Flavobacterium panacagri]
MDKNKIRTILIICVVLVLAIVISVFFNNEEKTYVLKKYDSRTKEKITIEYIIKNHDTIFHGKFNSYNAKGKKISEGNFVNGHIKGKSIYYFHNGIIESIHYRKNSKLIVESIYNYSNGKARKYLMYDDFGILDFLITYDEFGNVKNYQGLPLIEIYQYKIANKQKFKFKTNQVLKIGDTLKQQYLVANIPNAKRIFKVENLNVDNSKVKRTFEQVMPVGINVKEVLTKAGINKIRAIVKYEFNDNKKTVINDTVSFDVKVN